MNGEIWQWMIYLLVAGTLATDVWRAAGVFASLRLDESSEAFRWVRAISTALVAALIARIIFFPPGALAALPMGLRLAAFACGTTVFFAARSSILIGILAGEALLLAGGFYYLN